MTFHKKLGSYQEKALRIEALARWIAKEALGANDETARSIDVVALIAGYAVDPSYRAGVVLFAGLRNVDPRPADLLVLLESEDFFGKRAQLAAE